MTDPTANTATSPSDIAGMPAAKFICFLMFGTILLGIPFIAAGVLSYLKKKDVVGSWQESHLAYHFNSFVAGLIASVILAIAGQILGRIPAIGGLFGIVLLLINLAVLAYIYYRAYLAFQKVQTATPIAHPNDFGVKG